MTAYDICVKFSVLVTRLPPITEYPRSHDNEKNEPMIVHYTRTQVSNSHTASTNGLSGKHSDATTLTKYSPVTVIVCLATLRTECYWLSPHIYTSRMNAPTRLDEVNKQTLEIFCDQCHSYTESA
jgi:hypothetical protein